MIKTNFSISNMIELEHEGKNFDLHNEFRYSGLSHDLRDRSVGIRWHRKGNLHRGSTDEMMISLNFRSVDHLSLTARDPGIPFTEDETLDQIEYVVKATESDLEYSLDPDLISEWGSSGDDYCLSIAFRGGQKITIHSDEITLLVSKE